MSLHGSYDDNNLFAKILRGEIPAVKVYEDDEVLAFMDIFPQTRGHLLVVPKDVRARNLLELPAERVGPLMGRVHRLTIAATNALKPDGITVTQFNGEDAGQTIFHLHVHIIPRWEAKPLGRHASGGMAKPEELEPVAAKIRAEL